MSDIINNENAGLPGVSALQAADAAAQNGGYYATVPEKNDDKYAMIENLLRVVVTDLVLDATAIRIDREDKDGEAVFHLYVAKEDMGRVIGKQGRIAKAIRVIVRAGASRLGVKTTVEIEDQD
jgi:predicted RNA-binding protein YlqC (UPF0109 family)